MASQCSAAFKEVDDKAENGRNHRHSKECKQLEVRHARPLRVLTASQWNTYAPENQLDPLSLSRIQNDNPLQYEREAISAKGHFQTPAPVYFG
jgi:hypothetical protein